MRAHQQDGLQFFDALLVCTARRAGCHTFLTEDMQNDRTLDGITIRNPFLLSSADLAQVLEINNGDLYIP
jgi:predicted nucleic acid-binding protein